MRFVYLSRQANRSGYLILEHLLTETRYAPDCVILPPYRGRVEYLRHAAPSDAADAATTSATGKCDSTGSIDELARKHAVPVHHVANLNAGEGFALLRSYSPELIVLGGGWPQMLKPRVISCPPLGVINTHPSLLPEFRGTDVHRWQVLHGVDESGSSIHYVDESFDTGAIVGQVRFCVDDSDPPQVLARRAAISAGPLMAHALALIDEAKPRRAATEKQPPPAGAPYFSRWKWEDLDFLRLSWDKPAEEIRRFVLACTQESYRYNGPYFHFREKRFMVRRAIAGPPATAMPCEIGRVVKITDRGPLVTCGEGAIILTEVQPASDRFWPEAFHTAPTLDGAEFCSAFRVAAGSRFE
ncbi:hypothetical protein H0E84_02875 [Luteimonas sp. SJ-92]|uniref:Methionyl-tRNA formyltransferase n=1 Tax=Luteimonas salinisoli TaxID=2752307 RepID=A0A853J992_9GAMM|nr:formyltransferase family protein [Luteimonas salinisoli]NZA25314.1 hypothetical protein [Luteimonas salinisoli]